jgi:hypothetical protein
MIYVPEQFSLNEFVAMIGYRQFAPGFYGHVRRHPFHNPARGGMSWMLGGSSACEFTGWFVIDHIVYEGELITELELRFEKLCDGGSTPLHGHVHYVAP